MFLRTEKKIFVYESAWNLLKVLQKWKTMLDGKARNEWYCKRQVKVLPPSHYKRPDGIQKEKRQVKDNDFCHQNLNLLEKATKDADQRITAANQLNKIQERFAAVKEQNSELRVMLQDIMSADDGLWEYLCARRKEILGKIRNPLPLALTSAR
ncbi:hypothetical protein PtA15_14A36 [Puccinia triticina]|uniref:No apical meristem-associated C-terminal domain-containing protein n=1 Tax=Puccinia triticina TaxID=208348 RepID=A0ABY7D168_9BASI|nr:uncharacterized protein PtA15_14A36 [Puccinia triticina]WAQ91156.1 hypothetical protein PtA15_14A36 [Puccinia triticina]